jgi:hypothetical protein
MTYSVSSIIPSCAPSYSYHKTDLGRLLTIVLVVSPANPTLPCHSFVQPTVIIAQTIMSTRVDHLSRQWSVLKTPTSEPVFASSSCAAAAVRLVVILESSDAQAPFRLQPVDLLLRFLVEITQQVGVEKAAYVIRLLDKPAEAS